MPRTVGFPRMKKEPGEKRVFLPEFIQFIARTGAVVYIEEGYGSRSGFSFEDYHQAHPNVHQCSREEAFQKEIVIVLRSPRPEEYELIPSQTCLLSMLHFPTRPQRVKRLIDRDIHAVSMDSIVNDQGIRLVENMKSVAWNGLEVAFDVLEEHFPGLARPDGRPIHVLVLGTGMVGKHAVEAATKLGDVARNNDHIRLGGKGSIALAVGRNAVTCHETMEKLLSETDIMVDASQRRDSSKPVIPNAWIGCLPEHAIVVDLSVDPYLLNVDPPVVRGIEGIPQGNLSQYIFRPDDPHWDDTVPLEIPSQNRRTTITCYSWPGIHPEASMVHYAQQLTPLIEKLLEKPYDALSLQGDYFERAVYRGTLKACIEHQCSEN